MSEWWTYSLSDFLMFSPRTYRRLFELLNAQWWPAQFVWLAAGLGAVVGARRWPRAAALPVAAAWACVGYAFFWRHYTTINWAAGYVAIAFALQAVALLALCRHGGASNPGGLLLMLFGLLLQPLVGPMLLDRPISQMELFGLTPDPTVTVTLGLLAGGPRSRWSWGLWIVPLGWCVIGAATLWTMGDGDAWLMPVVAAVALVVRGTRM